MSAAELIGRLRPAPAGGATARRRRRTRTLARRRGVIAGLIVALLAAALIGGYLWLRGSALVSVDQVTIRGVSGPDAGQIRDALSAAARGMTTLEVRTRTLEAAVAPYSIVQSVTVTPHVPHKLTITVHERLPVAAATVNGSPVAVADDGTLLRDVATTSLPTITLRAAPGGPRITEASAVEALRLLGGAPRSLLGTVASLAPDPSYGLVATLRHGPTVRFGDATEARAKWQAVIALLSVPQNAGAEYLDVTDPHRPAAGVSTAAAAAAGVSLSSGALPGAASDGTGVPSTSGTSSGGG